MSLRVEQSRNGDTIINPVVIEREATVVAATIERLKAEPTSTGAMVAAYDGSGSTMTWTTGNFTTQAAARPQDYVQADGIPLTTGAWVRQGADGLRYDVAQSVQGKLDRTVYVTDARFAGGAKGNSTADDSAAIQAAIDYIESIGGGEVRVPEGTYKTTVAPILRGKVGLVGQGPASIIRSTGCHGLTIEKSDSIAPRRVANMRFYATGGETFAGIYADIAFPDRVQGLVFDNLFIDFFGAAIKGRGFWHTAFKSISANQCHRGIFLYDRNVKVAIDDVRLIHGGLITGDGPSIGIQIGDDHPTLRPENVQITLGIVFGFGKAIVWRQALFGGVTNCDLDGCGSKGLELVTADGGFQFSGNWIAVVGTSGELVGIHGVPLGYQPGPSNIAITDNSITVPLSSGGGNAATGIKLETNQSNISLRGNSTPGPSVALRMEGTRFCKVADNIAQGQAILINNTALAFHQNTFVGGMTLSGGTQANIGKNDGLHTTEIISRVVMPAGATSVTASFLSLNVPDLPLGDYQIACVLSERGMLNHGALSSISTRTGITTYCTTPLGADAPIDFHLRITNAQD